MTDKPRTDKEILSTATEFLNKDPDGFEKRWIDRLKGFGLFATQAFRTGDFLLNYLGRHIDEAPSDPYVYQYQISTGEKRCIDARIESESGLARYINDVDPFTTPNARAFILYGVDTLSENIQSSTISFRAIRTIEKGMYFH